MTLDEAIKHAEEIAEENEYNAQICHKILEDRLADFRDLQAKNNFIKCAEEYRQIAELLKELKQLREQTRWIPVSERMPEYDEYLIITHKGIMGQPIASASYFDGDFRTEDRDGYFSEVIAWMPLPQPYKAESEAMK